MKFEHCAGAGQFPASLVKPRSFHPVGHPQVSGVGCLAGGQVDGCSPYVPSIKDLARKREAAKAKGKAHDPNLGKLGVSMIDSCIKDRKYHEISLPVNFVFSFPLAPNAIHPPWHQQ